MFSNFSDEKIYELINCKKIIEEIFPKQGYKEINKWTDSRKISLISHDEMYKFEVFIRKHKSIIENFSIGLIYKALNEDEKNLTLCRYNGSHGETDWSSDKHYSSFHIHKINNDLLQQGITEPKEIEKTTEYSSFDSALEMFLNDIKVDDKSKNTFFPMKLFKE